MEQTEIEVKYHVADKEGLRQRILEIGASRSDAVFETNIRFDDADHRLTAANMLLRLRQDKKNTLTFKGDPDEPDRDFKIYKEIETRVDDFHATRQILNAIGFEEVQRYEKWRETFLWENTQLCLDTMPYGAFLEIEGDKRQIRRLSERLGLAWGNRIVANYLEMFEYIKNEAALPFSEVTFENFKTAVFDLSGCLARFQAGPDS